ncbi:pyridoxamine 5'-phosphate oxidase family protein [Actinomadura rudentiformis]|uniref:Pyridoxamine 5'-phosphate oxidase family protein n=1 Tax=Actinomadura rudentiformis TaxID=359158 RepID=A0A6H9Z9A2_9ACTN|nr:pyridoxamine 5'-phosphate oxidase family protein [Actinomadura rudentiformis]KAB2352245.1 pyridoxamine 5'-phosphate oxidase family protein [Actinomadura rudentiformis]
MEIDANGLEVLGHAECLALMQTIPIGRVVFTEQALPAVQPVNFVLDGDSVVIRTAPGSKLAAATRGAVVAFETDDFDTTAGTGWSVTAVGQARAVRDPKEIARLSRLPLQPWSPGPKEHFIRISCHRLTGRRIVPVAPGSGGQAA